MRNCDIKFVNKEITPFGGLSLFFKMLDKCHFEEHVMQSGVPLQGSNRGYKPIQLILGLFAGVWCGASCFGHLDVVRYDAALCDLLGWERGADHRAYQRYINKFSQAVNQRVFGNLFRCLTSSSCHPKALVKEFSYFLMPCHQHGLGVNLLVQR